MANTIEIIINAKNAASGVLDNVSDSVDKLGGLLSGGLAIGLGAATVAFGALVTGMGIALNEAIDAQNNLADLDATLNALAHSSTVTADEWDAAQGKVVEVAGLSAEAINKLQAQHYKLSNQIAGTTDAMNKFVSEHGATGDVYNEIASGVRVLQDQLAEVDDQLANSGGRVVSLTAALGLTAPVATMTKQAILELATSLRDLAGGSDDAVIQAETMLVGFKNIGKDIFPTATKAALDLAAKLHISALAAADMLGPILATGIRLNSLKRANITFTASEQKKISAMFAAGDAAGAQILILDKLNNTIGGTALEQSKTFSAQLEIFKNHILEVAEGIGNRFLPKLEELLAIVGPLVEAFANKFGALWPTIQLAIEDLLPHIEKFVTMLLSLLGIDLTKLDFSAMLTSGVIALNMFLESLGPFIDFWTITIPKIVADAQTQFQPIIDAVVGLVQAFVDSGPKFQTTADGMVQALQRVWASISPEIIANITSSIQTLTDIWTKHGDAIIKTVGVAWNGIVLTIGGALTILSGVISGALTIIEGIMDGFSLAFQGKWNEAFQSVLASVFLALLDIMNSIGVFFESVAGMMGTSMNDIRATWAADWELLQIIVKTFFGNLNVTIVTAMVEAFNNVKTGVDNAIGAVKATFAQWYNLGKDLVNNMLLGILSMVTQVINAVTGLIKDSLAAAGTALAGGIVGAGQADGKNTNGGKLAGFASGGSFTVGGSGGTDSQVVAFRATPGEPVSIGSVEGQPSKIINVNVPSVSSEVDVELLARRVVALIQGAA